MSNGFEEYLAEAQRLAQEGDIERAVSMLKAILEEDPTNEEVRREVINLILQQGDFQQAIVEYFDWAEACQVSGAIDDAIRIYQEILGLDTLLQKKIFMMDQQVSEDTIAQVQETIQAASGAIYFNLGYLYLEKGALDESISCLQKSLEFNPSDAKTHTLLGQVYMQKGMDKEAVGEFQEVVRLAPEEAAYAYEMLGEIFIRSGKPPQSTIVWFRNAGDLYVKHEQYEEAVRAYERILSFEPKNKDVLMRLGEVYARQGNRGKAAEIFSSLAEAFKEEGLLDRVIKIYEKLLEWDPENVEARDRIIEIYREILKSDPSNLTARSKLIGNILRKGAAEEAIPEFIALSETYFKKGMKKEAFAVCKKLLALDPRNARAHEIIADIFYLEGRKENALKEYLAVLKLYQIKGEEEEANRVNQKLMERFPDAKEVTIQMARSYLERGEYDKALLQYHKLLSEDPNNIEILESMLKIFEAKEDVDNVVAFAQRIMNLDPSRTDMQDKIIQIYEKTGNKEKIVELYSKILEEDPSRDDIRQKLISIYEEQGNQEKIIELYYQILEREPDRIDIRQKIIEYYASAGRIEDVLRESSALAEVFLRQNEVEKAEDLFKNVLAFIPDDINTRDKLCEIYEKQGHIDKVQDELLVLANLTYREGNVKEAVSRYKKLLEYTPNDVNVKIKVATLAADAGDVEEAVSQYKDMADLYTEKNMVEQAKDIISKILDVDESNIEYRKKLVDILKNQFKIEEAITHYKILLSHFLRMGQRDDAIVSAREAIALQPMNLDLRKEIIEVFIEGEDIEDARSFADELIQLYLNRSEYDEVVKLYERLSQIYKDVGDLSSYYEFRENIAKIYEREMRYYDAIEEYMSIIESALIDSRREDAERLFPVVIDLYFKEDRVKEAVEKFQSLVDKLQKFGRFDEPILVLEQMVKIHERAEKWEDALQDLKQMIDLYTKAEQMEDVIKVHRRRIEILLHHRNITGAIDEMFEIIRHHLEAKELDSAMVQFEEIERLEPEEPSILFRMAELLFEFGYYDEAKPLYERVIEKDPENYDAMARVAIIFAKAGKLQDAVVYTRKIFSKGLVAEVIDAYKKSTEIENEAQMHINLGLFYQEMGFTEEAILEFQEAAKDPKYLLEAYNLMALCFKQEGFIDLAIRQFERALEQPGYPEEDYLPIRYNLGLTLMENGQYQEALSAFYECYMVDINYKDISEKIAYLNEKLAEESF